MGVGILEKFDTKDEATMTSFDYTLALTVDKVVPLIEDMNLVTPETFDSFLLSLMNWYREESMCESTWPNVCELFHWHTETARLIHNVFVESLAWRYHKYDNKLPKPGTLEFGESEKESVLQIFYGHYSHLQESMIYDIEKTLKSMSLVYVWDSTTSEEARIFIYNNPITEVW